MTLVAWPTPRGGKNPHVRAPDNGESIPHQLGFKGVFILGGKTYIHTNCQERSVVTGAGARTKVKACHSFLKRNIPHPSGLVFQRLLAEGAEGTPAALWVRTSVTIG